MTQSALQNISHVVHITTDIIEGCERCSARIDGINDFAGAVNHYVADHGYEILHIGQETARDADGKLWQKTVTVLGN
jgi:hypothetical protein